MNRLAQETSPYLLQHAHNPVDWHPWGDEALQKAIAEDKPILVSIGYSACHWCHVMERESFEHEQIARLMNDQFVCIKVDREERPDVDALYMEAVQAMGVGGGWPLNVFLLPDTRPFYGLTYAPPRQWANLLASVRSAFDEHRDDLIRSAEGFAEHLQTSELGRLGLTGAAEPQYTPETVTALFRRMAATFDGVAGGPDRAPKFPMPSIYGFLLRYYVVSEDETALRHIELTLTRMALGGIYDQLGGGFARYSVDKHWFAPHFEKMLYDNAQLLMIYSEAYQCAGAALTKNPLYERIVGETIAFLSRELRSPDGGFYSALDADSEGVEGKFYTWSADDVARLLGDDYAWFAELNTLTPEGNWDPGHGQERTNILYRTETDEAFAAKRGWSVETLRQKLDAAHATLLTERDKRIRPGLDDKLLCSWNGLTLTGLVTAYRVFNVAEYGELARQLAHFLRERMTDASGHLWHTAKDGHPARQLAFLEDYAAVIQGYVALYQADFDAQWLHEADRLAQYVLDHFSDEAEALLFFTDKDADPLIARKKEVFDNVIPASNSIMARNLHVLSRLLDRPHYAEKAELMLGSVASLLAKEGAYLTNWAAFYVERLLPETEVVLVGPDAQLLRPPFDATFRPGLLLAGSPTPTDVLPGNDLPVARHSGNDLPLLAGRGLLNGKTAIYVCQNRACQLPVTDLNAALAQLNTM